MFVVMYMPPVQNNRLLLNMLNAPLEKHVEMLTF